MEDDLKKMKDNLNKQKMEDDLKKNVYRKTKRKILIPLNFRGIPFLGLVQLSKIFISISYIFYLYILSISCIIFSIKYLCIN